MKANSGFSLIELMIVVSIMALLAMISIPSFARYLARAKRAEAYTHLGSIYAAQKLYHVEHGCYCDKLTGPDSLGWRPDGYNGGGKNEKFYYTYGFAGGVEGTHHVTGKLETPASHLSIARAGRDEFLVIAAGDIDGDGEPDILSVDDRNNIRIIRDDLN